MLPHIIILFFCFRPLKIDLFQRAVLFYRMTRSSSEILNTSHKPLQSERPDTSSSPAWLSLTDGKLCSVRTERFPLAKTSQLIKEEEAEAECQKKFSALPVPSHIIQPIYQDMMEHREKERKEAHEQRKQFLLSIQKPFSFLQREKEKREKLLARLNQVEQDMKNGVRVRKPSPKEIKDSPDPETKGRFSFSDLVWFYEQMN